jgi:hypothetical protein
MSKQYTELTEAQKKELIACLEREDFLSDCLYVNGKPLTPELRKKLGFADTLEEARVRKQENKRKQEEAERQSKT